MNWEKAKKNLILVVFHDVLVKQYSRLKGKNNKHIQMQFRTSSTEFEIRSISKSQTF